MVISLYKFSKRNNSTAIPANNDSTKTDLNNVELKEGCSLISPTLILSRHIATGFNPVMFNYAYISLWQRYYFIKDWNWQNGVWECSMEVDVLASFRLEISRTTAMVERSATLFDGNIVDTQYLTKVNKTIQNVSINASYLNVAPSGGTFVVGIMSTSSTSLLGAVTYYALSLAQFRALCQFMFSSTIYNVSSIYDISEGLWESTFNPIQFITACIWFPFAPSSFGETTQQIWMGYWNTELQGTLVETFAQSTRLVVRVPDHPQISRGAYLNYSPYTKLTLYIPPFGAIPVDTAYMTFGNEIACTLLVDHITGQATLRISVNPLNTYDRFKIMTEVTGMFGIPIQMTQIADNWKEWMQSWTDVLDNAMHFNLGAMASSEMTALHCNFTTVTTSGAMGSFLTTILQPELMCEWFLLADEDRDDFGRPYYKKVQLDTLSGFIKCDDTNHQFSGTDPENRRINEYLSNGFFLE